VFKWGTFACLLALSTALSAQNDADRDRIARTTWHSSVLPGWGQVNNGKWWKVPLVYGALGVSGHFIQVEGKLYRGYRDGYQAMTDNDPTTVYVTQFDQTEVKDRRDFHRSNMEQSILTFALLWGAQVIDAHVDAQLLGFDVSEDLSWAPGVGPIVGVRLSRSWGSKRQKIVR
jgi:hypothetical protein